MFKKRVFAAVIALIIGFVCLAQKYSFAEVFDLSYSLTEGGYNLEFNMDNLYKGVDVDITSDVAARYEVIQEVIKPMENRDNPGRSIGNNLVFRAVSGRNRSGTLHVPAADSLVRSGEVLYTSDTAGSQDGFTLIYGITNIDSVETGYYYGKIGFILRPIESNREQVLKIIDLSLNISKQDAKPRIEISAPGGLKTIRLNSKKEGAQTVEVSVKISGSFEKKFDLTQILAKDIESKEGKILDPGAVSLVVSSAVKGEGVSLSPLSLKPQKIYSSAANGDADDYFIITYSLGDLSGQKAGRYSSLIQYSLDDGIDTQEKIEPLGLEIENEPVFDLLITFANQASGIDFSNLRPKSEPEKNEVIMEVNSNIGKPYQVSQKVYSGLKDKEGNAIAQENFTLFSEPLDATKGGLKILQKTEVKTGDTVLFLSDSQGASDKFKIIYELGFPREARAGDYSTQITYSLSEI